MANVPPNWLLEPIPHDEAAKWIEDKPVVSREVFDTLLPELRARAFLITGVEDANVAAEIRSLVAELPKGGEWETQKKEIANKLVAWFGKDAEGRKSAEARAELLLRTHGFQSYQTAQHRVMERQKAVFPFWQYITCGDEKVRPAHRALNEIVVAADDKFWHDHSPPWQWGCRCRKVALLPDEVDEMKAEDASKPPEAQRVLEGSNLVLANEGKLNRGPANMVDIRSDRMRGKMDGYHFDPGALTIPLSQLKQRYDDATWSEFENTARAQTVDGKVSVWDWLEGKKLKAAKKPKGKGAQPQPAKPSPTAQPAKPATQAASNTPKTQPDGTPITGKLDPEAGMDQAEKDRVADVLSIIDSVHGDGPLKQIPIGNTPDPGSLGEFASYTTVHKAAFINYLPPTAAQPLHPELTIAHEIGHWLDHSGSGKPHFATSDLKGELKDWWQATQQSAAIKAIQSAPAGGRQAYYLREDEVWARSYAQFIAEESGNATMLEQVAHIRAESHWADRHWDEQDFAPIREQMRGLFVKWGWMKEVAP